MIDKIMLTFIATIIVSAIAAAGAYAFGIWQP